MVTEKALLDAVDAAFAITARGMPTWRDPHPDRSPLDEEYSRLTDPAKWRIVGARADAWLDALVGTGLAEVEAGARVEWAVAPGPRITRSDRALPRAARALPLVVARSVLGPVDDAGVTLGAGDPAVTIGWIPTCGCDACDSGSQNEVDLLDEHVLGVVSGAFRRLWSGDREITAIGRGQWSASGLFARGEVEAILASGVGWHEVSGSSWIAEG